MEMAESPFYFLFFCRSVLRDQQQANSRIEALIYSTVLQKSKGEHLSSEKPSRE
jgi:hypothetical protein